MKISQRLTALSAFSAAGLLCVSAVSFFAVTSIQSDLRTLTTYATPLQNKTYEMQERTERWLGGLLKLSLAHEREEVDKVLEGIHVDSAAIDRLDEEIRGLDPMARVNATEFRAAQGEIVQAVRRRLGDEMAYRQETEHARLALQRAEATIALTRSNVAGIAAEASRTADEAQEASRRLASVTKVALSAQIRLKEIAMVVAEADLATNRFRLTPLRDKIRAATDSIQRLEIDAGSDDPLKECKAAAADVYEAFINDSQGLLAAREAMLAKKADAEAVYQRQRKALLVRLDEQSTKLGLLIDGTEAQAYQQRRSLEAALRLRGEPGGVIAASEEVSLGMREMGAALRELMLAVTPAESAASKSRLKILETELVTDIDTMRAALHKMGRPQLTANVDAALAAMASVAASIENVASAKRSLLDSEARTNTSLAHLKTTAALQASAGERAEGHQRTTARSHLGRRQARRPDAAGDPGVVECHHRPVGRCQCTHRARRHALPERSRARGRSGLARPPRSRGVRQRQRRDHPIAGRARLHGQYHPDHARIPARDEQPVERRQRRVASPRLPGSAHRPAQPHLVRGPPFACGGAQRAIRRARGRATS